MRGARRVPAARALLWAAALLAAAAPGRAAEERPAVDGARVLADVERLAAPRLRGRGGPEDRERTAALLVDAMRAAGLAPPPGREDHVIPLRPREGVPAGRHVAGFVPGREAGAWVLVVARYDGPDRPSGAVWPGADGNASGVAALLEAGRVLAAGPAPRRGVLFVALDLSVHGREGSRRLAADPPLDLEACVAVVDVEHLGRSLADGMPGSTFVFASRVDEVAALLPPCADPGPAPRVLGIDLCPLAETDALAFEDRGVPTLVLTAGPSRDDLSVRDAPDRIDAAALARRTRTLVALVAALADAPVPPPRGAATAPSLAEMEALASFLEDVVARADALGLTERERLRAGYAAEHVRSLRTKGTWTAGERTAARLFALEVFGALTRPR